MFYVGADASYALYARAGTSCDYEKAPIPRALGVSMYLKDIDPKLAVLEPKVYEAVYAVVVARSTQSRRRSPRRMLA